MKVAARFNVWTFKRIIDDIEDIIDQEKSVKHSFIQQKVENTFDNENVMRQFTDSKPDVVSNFLEYSLPVQIQSGGNFQINKFHADSSDQKLDSKAVYINLCTKYCDMSCMASRTLMVDPDETQEQSYKLAFQA